MKRTFPAPRFINATLALGACAALQTAVYADDISLLSGIYKHSTDKVDGVKAGSTSKFGLGGRFHQDLGGSMAWFAQGNLTMNSYDAAEGRSSPDNSLGIQLGGGLRHYFKPFGAGVVPYVAGGVFIENAKSVTWNSDGYAETTDNGLSYEGIVGLRAGLDSNFFVDLELPLFDSYLFHVAKTVTVKETGGTKTESKRETTDSQLWADTSQKVTGIRLAVGYKF